MRKLAVLLELAGVFIAGTLAARLLGRALGIRAGGIRDVRPGETVDYLALASATAASLLLRYGIILALAFMLGWWFRRRNAASYGVTAAGFTPRTHIVIAIVLVAVGGFIPKLLIFAKDHVPLGRGPAHWDLIASASSLDFWLYMAASSFVIVPIVEELFFRGYVQTRLGDAFGAPAAIVMTSLLFTLSHRQYFIASALGIGMLVSLFASSLFAGYVRDRYRTLLPGILAHALGNVPVRGWMQVVPLAAMLITIVVARNAIAVQLRELAALLRERGVIGGALAAVVLIVAVLAIAASAPAALLPVGVAALLIAIVMEQRFRTAAR